jgi:hypothetical protein
MTELTRPIKRKVRTVRDQPLVVTLMPEGIVLREPRRRKGFLLPYGMAFAQAARLFVEAERAKKRPRRKVKRSLL